MTEPDPAAVDPAPARRASPLVLVLSALAVLLAGAAVWYGLQAVEAGERRDQRREAVAAAQQVALDVTGLSSEDNEEALARIQAAGTGTFATDFTDGIEALRAALAADTVVSASAVVETAVVRADDELATVLVVVDGTVSNTASPEPQERRYRMKFELDREGDRWLVSMLEILS